jgi:hypothetical protein
MLLGTATVYACLVLPLAYTLWPVDPAAAGGLVAGAGPIEAASPPTVGQWLSQLAPSKPRGGSVLGGGDALAGGDPPLSHLQHPIGLGQRLQRGARGKIGKQTGHSKCPLGWLLELSGHTGSAGMAERRHAFGTGPVPICHPKWAGMQPSV